MKERIIGCSMELFARYGIKGITMASIVAELGISKRTIYEYFTCKEELVSTCLQSRLDENRLFDPTDKGLIDELLELYTSMKKIDMKNAQRLCCELQKFYYPVSKMLLERLFDYAAACGKMVESGIAAGYIRPETLPRTIRMAVAGYLMQLFNHTSWNYADVRNVLSPEVILIFTRGLCTIKGRAYLDQKLKANA